jgi:hypothetical protein
MNVMMEAIFEMTVGEGSLRAFNLSGASLSRDDGFYVITHADGFCGRGESLFVAVVMFFLSRGGVRGVFEEAGTTTGVASFHPPPEAEECE